MSELCIDKFGNQIWYDLASDKRNYDISIDYSVYYDNQPPFYVRPHREDGPAMIYNDGGEEYCIEGKRHREDGPAMTYFDGEISFYLKGKCLSFVEWCSELNKSTEEINFLKLKWNIV